MIEVLVLVIENIREDAMAMVMQTVQTIMQLFGANATQLLERVFELILVKAITFQPQTNPAAQHHYLMILARLILISLDAFLELCNKVLCATRSERIASALTWLRSRSRTCWRHCKLHRLLPSCVR